LKRTLATCILALFAGCIAEEDLFAPAPPERNEAALRQAARNGDHGAIKDLIRLGVDVNSPGSQGRTALHHATTAPAVKMLVSAGARPDCRDRNGVTPLLEASMNGKAAAARALIEAGANISLTDPVGATALHWAADGNHEEIVRMLVEAGADVHAADIEGKTPLHWSCTRERLEASKLLLEKGADINAVTHQGVTPLDYATRNRELIDYLRAHGAKHGE
jgi:ankyrin repeat protein